MRYTGVISRGITAPVFRQGDNLVEMVRRSVLQAAQDQGFSIQDGDVIGVTESVLARTQGNYADLANIEKDVREKLGGRDMGVLFPLLSRSRFGNLIRAFSRACDRLYIQLSYPADELGSMLVGIDELDEKGIDPYTDSFDERGFRAIFKDKTVDSFTGVNYVNYFKSLGGNIDIIFSNNPRYILHYTRNVVNCDIHTRLRTSRILKGGGAEKALRLDELMNCSIDGSGYNEKYGLLGSSSAGRDRVKLLARNCEAFVNSLRQAMLEATGKRVEVLLYGDGRLKETAGAEERLLYPAHTEGLEGAAREQKLRLIADDEFPDLSGEELCSAVKERISNPSGGGRASCAEGTFPRRYSELLSRLCELTGGNGDKGTPIILIQNYFSNYASL